MTINEKIRAAEVRVIDADGSQLGVMKTALALETVENTAATSRAALVLGSLIRPNWTLSALFLEIVDMHCFIPKSVSGATSLPASPTMTGVCNNKA